MILEVNNTFGERRIYLLDGSSSTSQRVSSSESKGKGAGLEKKSFKYAWMKDFHVSPFNSRKGSYALKALDPFNSAEPRIDNTITLKSSKDHAKLVARVHSTSAALDADSLGILETIRFVGSWWWVGLMTFPRILKEAARLFFKRQLNVFYRPEPLASNIGREPTGLEM